MPAEWLTEAVSSIDPANLRDVEVVSLLNDMRNRLKASAFPQTNSSASTSADGHVPTVIDAPSATPAATVQPSPPATDSPDPQQELTSLNTKANYMRYFNETYQVRPSFVPPTGTELDDLIIISEQAWT